MTLFLCKQLDVNIPTHLGEAVFSQLFCRSRDRAARRSAAYRPDECFILTNKTLIV